MVAERLLQPRNIIRLRECAQVRVGMSTPCNRTDGGRKARAGQGKPAGLRLRHISSIDQKILTKSSADRRQFRAKFYPRLSAPPPSRRADRPRDRTRAAISPGYESGSDRG